MEQARREREAKQRELMEAKRLRQEELARQRHEESVRRLQEKELKRQQAAALKEQVHLIWQLRWMSSTLTLKHCLRVDSIVKAEEIHPDLASRVLFIKKEHQITRHCVSISLSSLASSWLIWGISRTPSFTRQWYVCRLRLI